MRVLVIWEPILKTDFFHPSTGTLARVSDARVRQFWDPQHLVSEELHHSRAAISGQPDAACCENRGHFWDMAVVYAPGEVWNETLPAAAAMEGPVYQVEDELRTQLR
jgi:hypothetical protein